MGFLSICFVIILIVGLIGTSDIIKILIIGIPLLIIGYILIKKFLDKSDSKYSSEQKEYDDKYFNTMKYFDQGYSTRPMITGDYFASSYETYTFSSSNRYCKYANTSNCANCLRRQEHKIDNLFYYGVSYNCKEYNYTYDD